MSHKRQIINHLLNGGYLTRLEANIKFGCFELSARLGEIESKYNIEISRKTIEVNNKRIKRYWLDDKNMSMLRKATQ